MGAVGQRRMRFSSSVLFSNTDFLSLFIFTGFPLPSSGSSCWKKTEYTPGEARWVVGGLFTSVILGLFGPAWTGSLPFSARALLGLCWVLADTRVQLASVKSTSVPTSTTLVLPRSESSESAASFACSPYYCCARPGSHQYGSGECQITDEQNFHHQGFIHFV